MAMPRYAGETRNVRDEEVAETMTDEELAIRARQGCEEAFSLLVQRYASLVKRQTAAFRGAEVEAEDLAQEGLMGLLSAVRTYDPDAEASFHTYAGVCVRRRMLSAVKRSGAAKVIPSSELVRMDDGEDEALPLAGGGLDPAQFLVQKEGVSLLYDRLRSLLSEKEYKVLMLYVAAYSYQEIAGRLGMSAKAVDNALQRARRKLCSETLSGG